MAFLLIQRALTFLNNDVNLQHNSICLGNILVNSAGGKNKLFKIDVKDFSHLHSSL